MSKKFSRYERPPVDGRDRFRISETDLDLLHTILAFRFSPASELRRLVGGNANVIARRLRMLWEHEYVNRFAFPDIRWRATESHYYLDNPKSLDVLRQAGRIDEIHPTMTEEIENNRRADYANAAVRHQHMKLGFLHHELMISRLRFMLEMSCRQSGGAMELAMFRRGADLEGHKVEVPEIRSKRGAGTNEYVWEESQTDTRVLPVEPDAIFTLHFPARPRGQQNLHFCYEADRGTMSPADMLRKLRAYYFFIKKHRMHAEAFGIHPIRAVLVEAPDEDRALKLMDIARNPLVSGPNKRAGLFWFTISSLFTDPVEHDAAKIPKYLIQPTVVFDREWALPDFTKLALRDIENSAASAR
jgi:hypothetical protein